MLKQHPLFRTRRKRHTIDSINITPLVDVMLVLLIIFMVTSPMLVSGIQVDLPKTKSAALSGQDEPLSISIKRSGQLYINNTTIQKKDLVKRLRAITKENYSSRLFVRGDKQVGYGEVIEIIALLNKSGFSKVSLVTETDS